MVKLLFCAIEIMLETDQPWVPVFDTQSVEQIFFHIPSSPPLLQNVCIGCLHRGSWENKMVPAFGQYFQPSTRDSLGTMGNFIITPFAWLYTAPAQIVLMHAVDLHWLGWSWPSWRQQPLQDYYTADRRQSNVRVIKEAGWPNTKGLDIRRNHSL